MTRDNCDRCGILMASDVPQRIQGTALLCVECTSRHRSLSITGKWRVYFNRHGAEPRWEIAVRDVQLATIAETMYQKKPTADEDDGRPSAWFAVEGVLTINLAGFATIGSP